MRPDHPDAPVRARFQTRLEPFRHGQFAVEMLLPRAADELIDEAEFERDERLPYWAELWPSARALTRRLLEMAPPAGPVLELGCGVALPSLALRWRGVRVTATDYYPDALEFVLANARRNSIAPPETRLLDWRDPPPELGTFPLALAADVLYERRNAELLAELLPRVLPPDGRAWIADPGRRYRPDLEEALRGRGWTVEVLETRDEPSPAVGEGVVSRISIVEARPPRPRGGLPQKR